MQMTFEEAAKNVLNLSESPKNEIKLKLYGLYKQATIGNCNTKQPSVFEFTERAKWDAWESNKNKPINQAKNEYVMLVTKLLTADANKLIASLNKKN